MINIKKILIIFLLVFFHSTNYNYSINLGSKIGLTFGILAISKGLHYALITYNEDNKKPYAEISKFISTTLSVTLIASGLIISKYCYDTL